MKEEAIVPEVLLDKAIKLGLSFTGSTFPISIFPSEIRNIIAEVHECQGFPIDYIASAMLVAIAVGIGNTHLAELKRGWQESPILYVALVGRPGTNKSHPLSFAMKPFLDFDYQENKLYERSYAEYDNIMRMSRKERIEGGFPEQPTEPMRKRFLVSDITPEGLSFIHAQNKRGLCLWTDELSAWFKNFNRYNSGSEEQFWLSVFSAKATISDRKGNRSSIFIKRPYISVVGTIQKKILGELSKGERSSNGFIDRILFVIPNLQQKARWSKTELPEDTEKRWGGIIRRLIDLPCAKDEEGEVSPEIIPFEEEAKARLYMWQEEHARLCDTEANEVLVGVYCKLEIYIIRFCLIIQLARWVCGESEKSAIDLISVERAITLIDYFRDSAQQVQTVMDCTQLTQQQRQFLTELPESFQTAEALLIAERIGIKERAFKDFLSRNIGTLFTKERHGVYRKLGLQT
ncbi:Uncharacterised protein [Porphyromonas cangingivalis]|uniref:DUF3987 domain-containing protein n=1 Tax=Porphyromonas cangingivalis TaxID=36874 RepID=UPI000D98E662|nr:DUF3987 domain-containing protein [Porphyromonas cangingivalis]SPY34680.1 Uncharacterised protein [Porphyromonas cangingivalis]